MSDKKEVKTDNKEDRTDELNKAVQELLDTKKRNKKYSGWYFVKSY